MAKTKKAAPKAKKKLTKGPAPKLLSKKKPRAAVKVPVKAAAQKTKSQASRLRSDGKVPAPPPSVEEATIEGYVSKVAPWQRTVIEKLRTVLRAEAPRASESMKWGQPVYDHKGPFSYIKAHAAQVNFGFWRGADLDDPKRMLQGEGERMRHVKIVEAQIIDDVALGAFVRQAFTLNDKKGDPRKG
jgi:hypothetical protein